MTFNKPEDANSMAANVVAANGTFVFGLENVLHRTTAMGRTCKEYQQLDGAGACKLTVMM